MFRLRKVRNRTREQNIMGDVAGENTQKHKRTSSEISSSPDKARRDLFGDLKFLWAGELTEVLVSLLATLYPVKGTRTPLRYSWAGQPWGVWGRNPIKKVGLAGIGCQSQLPQYLSAGRLRIQSTKRERGCTYRGCTYTVHHSRMCTIRVTSVMDLAKFTMKNANKNKVDLNY